MADKGGFILLNTGNGKGKTTAAMGAALRILGHGKRVCLIQFLKSKPSAELESLGKFGDAVEIHQTGKGFVGVGGKEPKPEDIETARTAFELAKEKISSGEFDLVILDEITYLIGFSLVPVEEICGMLDSRPEHVYIFMTGRDAHPELVKRAAMVTEMKEVKHPFQSGVKARKGIEF
jgi:cob(I)alamin adenosyltransferase